MVYIQRRRDRRGIIIMSDYYDSAEGIKISRDRVLCELKDHGVVDFKEFFDDLGDKKLYSAQTVLEWLGY